MASDLKNLKLHEVSLVDSPANKHAKVMLFKRAAPAGVPEDGDYPSAVHKRSFTAAERQQAETSGAALPGGGFPIESTGDLKNAIRAIGRAKDPAKVKAHIQCRAKALGLSSLIPDTWGKADSGNLVVKFFTTLDAKAREIAKAYSEGAAVDFDTLQASMEASEASCAVMAKVNEAVNALGTAVAAIEADSTITDTGAAVQKSLGQFSHHVKSIVPEGVDNALVAAALSQAGYTITPEGDIQLEKQGADSMTIATVAKKLGLPETATLEQVLAKMDAADTARIEAFSPAHLEYIGKLNADDRAAFVAAKADDREKKMKDMPKGSKVAEEDDVEKSIQKGDAFRTEQGVVLTKKDFGSENGFQFAKQQAKDNATLRADVQKGKDTADTTARITKAAAEFSTVGKAEDVGTLLHQIAKHDPKLADQVEALFKGAHTLIQKSALFGELGQQGRHFGKAADAIQKGGEALLTAEPALKTIDKARTEFRKRNPAIAKQESEEARQARQQAN